MSVIVLDGPEKAGKTSLARAIMKQDPRIRYRHWGPVSEHFEYYEPLMEDVALPYPVIWDRSWASEAVYAGLLNRPRILGRDPFEGEWLYGRSVITNGFRIMLVPALKTLLERPRSKDDLPVDPELERTRFESYAERWGWNVFAYWTDATIHDIVKKAWQYIKEGGDRVPPQYAGYWNPPLVFVGETRNKEAPFQIPFSTEHPSKYGRILAPRDMLKCGWTNSDEVDPTFLQGRSIVACGAVAQEWCNRQGLENLPVPHPSYLYRWAAGEVQRPRVEDAIRTAVLRAFVRSKVKA